MEEFDFLALANRKENYNGMGGGAGKPLTPVEEQVLQVMQNRDSDLVDGIEGGDEIGLPISADNARTISEQVTFIVVVVQLGLLVLLLQYSFKIFI